MTKPKRQRATPPPSHNGRTRDLSPLTQRWSAVERAAVESAAETAGETLSRYIRSAALKRAANDGFPCAGMSRGEAGRDGM
jgi:hypothetical protein